MKKLKLKMTVDRRPGAPKKDSCATDGIKAGKPALAPKRK
jgi:hypothetical protein